jgi:hypothetical protein
MDNISIVTVEFELNGDLHYSFATDGSKTEDRSLPESNIGSYKYTGRHDYGQLPMMKSSGVQQDIVNALFEAKEKCDNYLTERIEVNSASILNPEKKMKF